MQAVAHFLKNIINVLKNIPDSLKIRTFVVSYFLVTLPTFLVPMCLNLDNINEYKVFIPNVKRNLFDYNKKKLLFI